jgi:trehalose 6-phosphate phosphatase
VPPDRLRAIASHREQAGILLDFDGTLSEIVPSPEEARPVAGAAAMLEQLAASFRVVAVVSGRRAGDVAALLGANVRYIGLYGLEDGVLPERDASMFVERVLPDVEEIAGTVAGAHVEHKGVQLAVHYRAARDPVAAVAELRPRLQALAEAHGLTLMEGKRVLELAAAGGPTKGDVVESIAAQERLRHVVYAGDDVADLEAFAAVDRLVSSGVSGVKLAVRSEETPEALLTAADLQVDGPAGLMELLRSLIRG